MSSTWLRMAVCSAVMIGTSHALLLSECRAIVINDDWFTSSGGNTADVAGTLDAGYSQARAYSFQNQFLAVGTISGCSCTWIGNDASRDSSYFLTASHCIETDPKTEVFTHSNTFTDWNDIVRASGTGTGHIPPERVAPPPGYGGSSTDIAIFELPGQVTILDGLGRPVERPLFYDGAGEVGHLVSIAGYGSWGIGSQGSNGGLFPSSGPRRAGGTNIIGSAFEANHALSFNLTAPSSGGLPQEATPASGDSGSAWWQFHSRHWAMVATTCCGSGTTYGTGSNGTRISQYIDWIRSVYPLAQLWSEADLNRADINQDTFVNQLDVDLFVPQWRKGSLPSGPNPADFDMNGLVNLVDAFILHRELELAGAGGLNFALLTGVPEPGSLSLTLFIVAVGLDTFRGRRGNRVTTYAAFERCSP